MKTDAKENNKMKMDIEIELCQYAEERGYRFLQIRSITQQMHEYEDVFSIDLRKNSKSVYDSSHEYLYEIAFLDRNDIIHNVLFKPRYKIGGYRIGTRQVVDCFDTIKELMVENDDLFSVYKIFNKSLHPDLEKMFKLYVDSRPEYASAFSCKTGREFIKRIMFTDRFSLMMHGLFKHMSKMNIKINRERDNFNTKSFDFIQVEIPMCAFTPMCTSIDFVSSNRKLINRATLLVISRKKQFRSYGVSVKFLQLTEMVVGRDDILYMTYEIRKSLRK